MSHLCGYFITINFNLEDRFRQNIVGSFQFICLCPLFVFYLAKWFWDVPNSLKLHTRSNEWSFHLFLSIFQFWENKYLQPTTAFLPSRVILKKNCTKFFDFFRDPRIQDPRKIWEKSRKVLIWEEKRVTK